MPENDKPVLIYSTFPSLTAAEAAGARLVEARLAACVNILPGMTSLYRWQGRTERGAETVMIIKTRASLAEAAMQDVAAHHDYDTPALLVIDIAGGAPGYCSWLMAETEPEKA